MKRMLLVLPVVLSFVITIVALACVHNDETILIDPDFFKTVVEKE